MKVHHVGLIVDDIQKGKEFFQSLIPNLVWSDLFVDRNIGVSATFGLDKDGICYELIFPLGTDSPVSNYLAKNGNMMHQIAYTIENFEEKIEELRRLELIPLGEPKPAVAFK